MRFKLHDEFESLLEEHSNAETREDKLIKHKLDSIVALYNNCTLEEREFVDEITCEFVRIIKLLKKQHEKEMENIGEKYDNLLAQQAFVQDISHKEQSKYISNYTSDMEVLSAFYEYFKGDDRKLEYEKIGTCEFENEEDRKQKVNLTIFDYCNRIKTFASKYLYEIFPAEDVVNYVRCDDGEVRKIYGNIVFTYNNLEIILAKINTKNKDGKSVKQKVNMRSALRKLNKFKQETETCLRIRI